MAPPPNNLPEGTDSIIPGAAVEGEAGDGFALGHGRDFNPIPLDPSAPATAGASAAPVSAADLKDEAKRVVGEKTAGLRDQAADTARSYLLQGKDKATDALDNVIRLVDDAAAQIDDKVGSQYGDYVRRLGDTVDGFASQIRDKDVDDLIDDARELVRGNPALAIGAAAAVGFLIARVAKVGLAPAEAASAQGGDAPAESNAA